MKIRVGDIRMVVREMLCEAQRDADYLKKINMHKIRGSEPDLDPRELQKRSLDGPIFDKSMIDYVASIPDHELPRENRKQFVKWLARATVGYKGFPDVGYVTDWINGAGIQISDLPDNFTDAFELARQWHDSLSSEKLGSAIEVTGQENVIYEFSDGFKILELTPEECESEGDSMQHCVGGDEYAEDVRSGKMKLFSLRDPENRPHTTVSVVPGDKGTPWKVDQIKGKQNQVPIEKYARRVKEWLGTTDFEVFGSGDYFSTLSVDKKRDFLTKNRESAPEAFLELVARIASTTGLSAQDLTRIVLGATVLVIDKVPDPKRTRKLLDVVRDWTRGRASDKDVKRVEKELWKLYNVAFATGSAPASAAAGSARLAAACADVSKHVPRATYTSWAISDVLEAGARPQEIIDSIENETGMPLEDFLFTKISTENVP